VTKNGGVVFPSVTTRSRPLKHICNYQTRTPVVKKKLSHIYKEGAMTAKNISFFRIIATIIACLTICFSTHAAQIEPNPNLAGSTINITNVAENSLNFSNSGTINVTTSNGYLANYNTLTNNSGGRLYLGLGGIVSNLGTLNNNSGATTTVISTSILATDGTLNNSGRFENYGGELRIGIGPSAVLNNNTGGVLDNTSNILINGILNNNVGATLNSSGSLYNYTILNNSGTLTNQGSISGGGTYTQTAGQTVNNGSMSQNSVQIKGGALSGYGVINAPVTLGSGAILTPGSSAGTLTINGSYTQNALGTLQVELLNNSVGGYDRLVVSGLVTLDGAINLSLLDGYTINDLDTFSILHYGSKSGAFTNWLGLDPTGPLYFTYDYGDHDLTLTAHTATVPVPPAVWLLGSGLIGLVGLRRKFRK
jgi:hypothetical protein